jgi:GDP-L-fucose synthase
MNIYKNKKVLVTGGTGLIGLPLVNLLLRKKAKITIASLDSKSRAPKNCKFIRTDLTMFSNCMKVCKKQDFVFNLVGIKGSPDMAKRKPASFMTPTVMFSVNMIEAARRCNVKKFMFTSSIGVYAPSKVFYEEDVWKTFPSENDKFAGWAKRIGELLIESFKIQYNLENFYIVRPANVYGPGDNFDKNNAMVVPSLISRAFSGENPLKVWGDGSAVRDIVYSEDVAKAMIKIMENKNCGPINIGSGKGVSVKKIAETIIKLIPKSKIRIHWDKTKPTGDKIRLMSIKKAKKLKIKCKTNFIKGIKKTIAWYLENKENINNRYNQFK